MSEEATVKRTTRGLPAKTVRVVVLSGADRGRELSSESERIGIGSADNNDLVLSDRTVSRYHLELTRGATGIQLSDVGSTNGTRVGPATLRDGRIEIQPGTEVEIGETRLRIEDGEVVVLPLHDTDGLASIRGRSPAMRRVMATLSRVAAKDAPVLIIGESGTGKELCARAVHELGPRAQGPFVTVDCAAIPASLFAADLFGHERGAFTGADRRSAGAFEQAHGGTLFLDEVGELPLELQASLLGVLERRRVKRLGGRDEIDVDVRLVSATNRDLRAEVNAGSFRLDLFYRLAVVVVEVPPLRERREDIPLLIEHFLRESGHEGESADVFSEEALRSLVAHRFPGNVRELRNVVASALALGPDRRLELAAVAVAGEDAARADAIADVLELDYKEARNVLLREFERRYLEQLIQRTKGNVRQAAREAGIDRTYLTGLLKRHGLH